MAKLLAKFVVASAMLGASSTTNQSHSPIIPDNNISSLPTLSVPNNMGKDTLLPTAYIHCDPNKYGALVMDGKTGAVILSYNAHKQLYPASMVKMMTTLLALEKLECGEWQENTVLKAQTVQSSTVGLANLRLHQNQPITVANALKGTFIVSAANAAQTLAVEIAGNAEDFVTQMNNKAKTLGMDNTHFENASGDKDHKLGMCKNAQVSSPYDIAILMKALWEKGQNYSYLLTAPTVNFGKEYKNHALKPKLKQAGMVVGKTGYFKESGLNIAGLFEDNIIAVVYGGISDWDRAQHLLDLKKTADSLVNANQPKPIWPDITPINPKGLNSGNFYQPPINH